MGVRDRLGKHDDDRVATDLRTAPANLSMCVQHHAVRLRLALREPGLAGKALVRRSRVVPALGELLTRDPTNQPAVSGEFVVHSLEKISGGSVRPPAAGKRPTIDAGGHKADDMRFHANLVLLRVRSAGTAGCLKVTFLNSVLLVAHLFQPVDVLSIERFLNRDVRHRVCRRGAVPVLQARWKPHDVPWSHLLYGSALALNPSLFRDDDQRLAQRMRVPGSPCARFKGDLAGAYPRGSGRLKQRVHPNGPREPVRRAFRRRTRTVSLDVDIHVSVSPFSRRSLRNEAARPDRECEPAYDGSNRGSP